VPENHPLRTIRPLVNSALPRLSRDFDKIYFGDRSGFRSRQRRNCLRALLLQAFFSVRSERQLMEAADLQYDVPLVRWSVDGCTGVGRDGVYQETVSVCWRATSLAASWLRSWWTRRSSHCCRMSISRSMGTLIEAWASHEELQAEGTVLASHQPLGRKRRG